MNSPRLTKPDRAASAAVAFAALLVTSTLALGCNRPPRRPNVVLISIDCLNERQFEQSLAPGRAPNLARLAQDALVFPRAYAHAPWTTPSHMSMLTGLYPLQHGRDIPYRPMIQFHEGDDRVPLYKTLPERLAAAGYETVGFVGSGSASAAFGLSQGFSSYHESSRSNPEQSDLPENLAGIRSWMDGRSSRPFFLFLHTYELHNPLAAGRSPFRRALDYIDGHLGVFLSLLRERGLYDSSLIILTGDHGSHMLHAEGKCCVHGAGHYEENLRVPFVLKLPAGGPTGHRDQLVRHVDILPTVLDVAGLPAGPYGGPGSSILGRLARRSAEPIYSFSEADGRCAARRAVVDLRYKYIYTPDRPLDRLVAQSPLFFDDVCSGNPACAQVPREELYDLDADPFEQTNLLNGPLSREATAALDRLRVQMTAHINRPPAYRHRLTLEGSPTRLDDSTREALRALGYIQ
jgi:arylsulfatase A-like enzyme